MRYNNKMLSYEEIYKKICRVCLSIEERLQLVCLTDNNSEDGLSCYGKAVTTFAHISIKVKDKLPRFMCSKCLKSLKQAIHFKLKCESSDKQLLKWSKLHKNKDSFGATTKEVIVQNIMFTNYFPDEASAVPSINKCHTQSSIISNDLQDKTDIISQDGNEENQLSLSDVDSSDEMLDRMQQMIDQYPKKNGDSSDELLVNMEKSIGKYANKDNVDFKNSTQKSKKTKSKMHTKKFLKQATTMTHKVKKIKNLNYINSPQSLVKKKFICKICNKDLANRATFKYHMQRHTGCSFICEQCGKGFPLVGELQLHQVSRHGTGPHLPCKHCNFKAAKKHILVEHERIHTGERPYTCDKCGLTFRRRAIWRKHMIYHTEKTVQCLQCPRKFFRRSEMEAHANSMHERVYVYLCHKCDATYAKTSSVRRHLTERHGIPREMQGKIVRINKSRGTGHFNSD